MLYTSAEIYLVGPIAQSVEQRTFNPWVDGSSPSGPTTHFSKPRLRAGFFISISDMYVIGMYNGH